MAPKKKKKDDGGGGKKEAVAAPSYLETEELKLKIFALEDKLMRTQQKLEAAMTEVGESKQLLEKQQADQADIVDYLKKEIEKKTAENQALERKYILLREAKENEEIRLQHELEVEKQEGEATKEARETALGQNARLESRLDEYETLKQLKVKNQSAIDGLETEMSMTKSQLEMARTHLHILAAPDGENVGEDGSCAVPLLLCEAMRMYVTKPILQEQACAALQAVLSGDRKEDSAVVRKNGGVLLLLDVMKQHEAEAGLQSAACGLLWKLAFTDPPTRKIVVKEGGIHRILQAMQKHLNHPRLQYNACGALRNLLVEGTREFSVASQIAAARPGELPPVHGATREGHSADGGPRGRGRGRVGGGRSVSPTLGAPGRGGKKMHHVRSLPALRGRPGDKHEDPARRGGRLESTSPTPPRRDELPDVTATTRVTVSEQGLSLTLKSMAEHADQPLVQEYGCGTLYNLMMANPEIKQKVAEENGVRSVLAAMKAHPSVTGVQLNACATLQELSTFPKTLEHMKGLGARALVEAAVAGHPYNQDLIAIAERALTFLPRPVEL